MEAAVAWDLLVTEYEDRGVLPARMMGRPILKDGRRMVACLSNDVLGFRLGRGTEGFADAMAQDGAHLWTPAPESGRVFRDWVGLTDADPEVWRRLLDHALVPLVR